MVRRTLSIFTLPNDSVRLQTMSILPTEKKQRTLIGIKERRKVRSVNKGVARKGEEREALRFESFGNSTILNKHNSHSASPFFRVEPAQCPAPKT